MMMQPLAIQLMALCQRDNHVEMRMPHASPYIWRKNYISVYATVLILAKGLQPPLCLSTAPHAPYPLSDMLMLLIPIGKRTEPSADKKTMLTAAHGFPPRRCERCVCRLYRSSRGSHNLLSRRLYRRGPSGLCTNSPLPSKRRECSKFYRMSSMDVSACVFLTIRAQREYACVDDGEAHGRPLCLHRIFLLCAPDCRLDRGVICVYSRWYLPPRIISRLFVLSPEAQRNQKGSGTSLSSVRSIQPLTGMGTYEKLQFFPPNLPFFFFCILPSMHLPTRSPMHPVNLPRLILILLEEEIRSAGGSRKEDSKHGAFNQW